LIDQSDQPRVTDFGLAKQLKGDSDLTISGQVLGSPNFMPPEQAAGKRAQLGPHSDIYALGAILYYLLTARPPFAAESMTETLQLVVTTEPPSPRLLNPGVPRDVETICLKCLAKEPGRRYRTASELAEELNRFIADRPILARPAGRVEKSWRWCRRNPVVASFAGATAVLLLAVAIGSPIAALRINRERKQARQNLLRQYVANGNRLVEERDPLSALPWFAKALREEQDDPARAEIHRLRLGTTLQHCPRLLQMWFPKEILKDAALSPDGRLVLIAGSDGLAQVWDATTGEAVGAPMDHNTIIERVAFSPDGQRVATASAYGVGIWDFRTGHLLFPLLKGGMARFSPDGRLLLIVGGRGGQLFDVATGMEVGEALKHVGSSTGVFSPDARRVLTTGGDSAQVWDAATGKPVTDPISYYSPGNAPDFGQGEVRNVSVFSPDGSRFALACDNQMARVCDAVSGKDLVVLRHRGTVRRVCFSPDGRWLATASHDSTAQVWDVATGAMISPPLRHKGGVMDVSFSADGRLVVTASTDGTARVWDAATGTQVGGVLQHAGSAVVASLTPDAQRVFTLSTDGAVRIWELGGAAEAYRAVKHPAAVQTAAFSSNGRWAVTASVDGTAHVWDLTTGQSSTGLETNLTAIRTVQFAPDSHLLAVGTTNGTARVWDLATSKPASPVLVHTGLVNHLEFSPDGSRLLTAASDGLACVWEIASGRLVSEMRHRESVNYASFTPDGSQVVTAILSVPEAFQSGEKRTFDPVERKVITANWGQAQLWNAGNGQPLTSALNVGLFVSHVSFSPDRRRVLATCSARGLTENQVWVVDLVTGRRLAGPLEHDKGLIHGSLSPDGKWAVTTSWDHTARVWDVTTGKPVGPRLRHQTYVYYAAFSPDNRLVVTASADRAARVWDAATGEPVTPPLRHGAAVNRVFFGPGSRYLLVATADGEVRVWNLAMASRPVPDEVLSAQLLAGHWIDDTDAVLPMKTEGLESAWTKLRAQTTLEDSASSQPVLARKALPPAVEEEYHVPGEDTETSVGYRRYASQVSEIWNQVLYDRPLPSTLSSSLSNQLAGFLEVCSQAIEADPDPQHGGQYHVRARVYEWLGQHQKAIDDMREWLWRIGPIPNRQFLVKQYFMLGHCYWRLGETEKAQIYLQRAQECASEDADACKYLAVAYSTGPTNFCSLEKALPLALKAVELSKTNPPHATALAEVYSRLGQTQHAADILDKAIQLHPNSGALTWIRLALFYVDGPKATQSPEKALPLALKAVELSNTDPLYAPVLVEIYLRLGQWQKAVDLQEKVIQLHPDAGSEDYNNLAWYYVTGPKEIQSPEKALPLALKAVELGKTNHNELNTLGVVYYRLGQLTNAIATLETGIKTDNEGGNAHDFFFLAMSYHRLGDLTWAESCYAKATKWLNENAASLSPQNSQELAEFRAEAEEVLGKRKKE
jgi:WD40 repeat protein/tetratricopeptide (TPR) repeat protein